MKKTWLAVLLVSTMGFANPAGMSNFGLGLSSYWGGLSFLAKLNPKLTIELLPSITTTSPLIFTVGAIGRVDVSGDFDKGLHIGGGVRVGSSSGTANVLLVGVGGFHFTLNDRLKNIFLQFDGMLGLNFGPLNLSLGSLPVVGVLSSIHYIL